ncbi:MAG: class I SAM-dependent methyltransferase [Thermomicrobiales bacterium]|nr:class I SAM-dependent methyltransferase [Thermomicrobiales bacterium]
MIESRPTADAAPIESDPTSRYIRAGDPRADTVVYPLPSTWWSRPYEYAWATRYVARDDFVLDAACGICHPFKFWLAVHAAFVYACDWDPRITSTAAILDDIRECAGETAATGIALARYVNLDLARCDMTAMPYADELVDRVFCISVLEHLSPEGQIASLREFARVLKPNGLIVMTVDHPTVDIAHIERAMKGLGMRFAGATDFSMPGDAISSSMWGPELRCIRLLIEKVPTGSL